MLFAEVKPQQQDIVQSGNFWLTIGLLMAVLLGSAAVLSLVERWRKRQAAPAREGLGGLALYREMYDEGELDEEEYRVIRDRFAKRLKGKPVGPELAADAGGAGGAKSAGSPGPPPESPEQAPPIS